jgi:hypothetical protein
MALMEKFVRMRGWIEMVQDRGQWRGEGLY